MNKYLKLLTPSKDEKGILGIIGACSLGLGAVTFMVGAGYGLLNRITR